MTEILLKKDVKSQVIHQSIKMYDFIEITGKKYYL